MCISALMHVTRALNSNYHLPLLTLSHSKASHLSQIVTGIVFFNVFHSYAT